ncbi:MAG: hypothetical protein R2851_05945 [Caldilineaceae bacterium]
MALIGAGIFMRDAHLPSLLKLALTSTWRPSTAAPTRRPRRWPTCSAPVDLYTDLDALLARPDIAAVDIAPPIKCSRTYCAGPWPRANTC